MLEFIDEREYAPLGRLFIPLDGGEPTPPIDVFGVSPTGNNGEANLARAGGRWFRRDFGKPHGDIWREIEAEPMEREFAACTETVSVDVSDVELPRPQA